MKATKWFIDDRYSRKKFNYLVIVQLKTTSYLTVTAAGKESPCFLEWDFTIMLQQRQRVIHQFHLGILLYLKQRRG